VITVKKECNSLSLRTMKTICNHLVIQTIIPTLLIAVGMAIGQMYADAEQSFVKIGKNDNGREITVHLNDIIEIVLDAPGGTGAAWHLENIQKDCLELIKEEVQVAQAPGLTGSPVYKSWQFRAKKKGASKVHLYLYREWEGKDKYFERFIVAVKIL